MVIVLALVCLVLGVPVLIANVLCALFGPVDRAFRAEIGGDQMLNALTGGSEDETISSRGGRGVAEGSARWCAICAVIGLLFWDRKHCENSRGQ